MAQRITKSHLNAKIAYLNRITGSPPAGWVKPEGGGRYIAQVGNYHLDPGLGGYALHRMLNEGGAVKDVFYQRYPAGQMAEILSAYIKGIEEGKVLNGKVTHGN